MPKKRGKFSNNDINFIRRNVAEMSDEDIAQQLNRTVETIAKFVKLKSLRPQIDQEASATRIRLKQTLHEKKYWPIVEQQFTDTELRYFEEQWTDMQLQFKEDMLPSEEMQLKQYLTIEISMNRAMRDRRQNQMGAEDLQQQLDKEYKAKPGDRDKDLMANLSTQIAASRASVMAYTTEYAKLSDVSKYLTKALKASRDDRIKRVEDSKTSWQGLLRMLEDEERRSDMGEEAELFKIAAEQKAKKLAEFHEYEDGKVDQPLLDVEYLQDE